MSHKQAKKERKQAPKIEHQIVINCYSDGTMDIQNLPTNYDTAMKIIGAAQDGMHGKYIKLAMAGRLDQYGNVIPEQKPEEKKDTDKTPEKENG